MRIPTRLATLPFPLFLNSASHGDGLSSDPRIESKLNDRVTDHMRAESGTLRVGQTTGEAMASLQINPPQGRIIYFYVVDDEKRVVGVVPTRRLLLSDRETPLRQIMVTAVVTIPSTATVLEACEFFLLHRLLAFPVVDAENRLQGIVDVELYTEELSDIERREGNDNLFQLIGVHYHEGQQTSPVSGFGSRFPWLGANIAGGIMAAFLSGIFEAELQQVVALALFIPVVLALAESVTIQSVSLGLQELKAQRPTIGTILDKLRVESLTGAWLGLASGLIVAGVALVWLGRADVAVVLFGGIAGSVACAAVIGTTIPNVLRLLKREPHVASGPIALATSDMFTLLIYFNLARWVFS